MVTTTDVLTMSCALPVGSRLAPIYPVNTSFWLLANVKRTARFACESEADFNAISPASDTSQMFSKLKVAGLAMPGICFLTLSWMVVTSMKSKSPPEALMSQMSRM